MLATSNNAHTLLGKGKGGEAGEHVEVETETEEPAHYIAIDSAVSSEHARIEFDLVSGIMLLSPYSHHTHTILTPYYCLA